MADTSKFTWLSLPATAEGALGGLSATARGQLRREGRGRRAVLRVPTHEHMLGELLTRVPDGAIRREVCLGTEQSPHPAL